MVDDARRLEPLAEEAAGLLGALAGPRRLIIVCDLIQAERRQEDLVERLGIDANALEDALVSLESAGIVDRNEVSGDTVCRLCDIRAAEIADALCSAFLGEEFSHRARIPFRPNRFLKGGQGKFKGANI